MVFSNKELLFFFRLRMYKFKRKFLFKTNSKRVNLIKLVLILR